MCKCNEDKSIEVEQEHVLVAVAYKCIKLKVVAWEFQF